MYAFWHIYSLRIDFKDFLSLLQIGLAQLIKISVNRAIYNRKTIINRKLKNRLLSMDILFIYSIKIQT